VRPIPFDFEHSSSNNTNASAEVVEVELDANETKALLGSNGARRPEQLLIATLANCLSEWTASRTVLIDILSHGRDATLETADLSRTVGFTLSYNPLVIKVPTDKTASERFVSVTEQVREIPEGFTFDLLRFLASGEEIRDRLAELPRAEVLFNYDGPGSRERSVSIFDIAPESYGPSTSPRGFRQHPLAVRATIDGNLRLTFVFSTNLHRRATIHTLANQFKSVLMAIIDGPSVVGNG
jgi:non-ribosomal peptide synthase protein (TIGR01720 family)